MSSRKASRPPARAALVKSVVAALEDMKASNIKVIDVRGVTDVSDCMVIASGNSDRHVRSTADRVVEYVKKAGFRPMGIEGERDGEWVLVDCNDVIVHVMLPRVREFYALESLWETAPKAAPRRKAAKKVASKAGKTAAKSGARRPAARGKAAAKSPVKSKAAARKPATRAKTARKGS